MPCLVFCSHSCHKSTVLSCSVMREGTRPLGPGITPCLILSPCACSPLLCGVTSPLLGTRTVGAPRNPKHCRYFPCSLGPPFAKPPAGQTQLQDPELLAAQRPGDLRGLGAQRGGDSEAGVHVGRAEGCAGACAGSPCRGAPPKPGTGGVLLGQAAGRGAGSCPATARSAAALPRQVTRCSGPLRT